MKGPKERQYKFTSRYQFDGERNKRAIIQKIKQHFLFPCWTSRYKNPDNLASTYRQTEHTSQYYNSLSILDVRSFKLFNDGKIDFVVEDQKELADIRSGQLLHDHEDIDNIPMNNIKFYNQSHQVIENFKQEAKHLIQTWDTLTEVLQQKYQEKTLKRIIQNLLKSQPIIKIYIFQRILQTQSKKQLGSQFFLIRCERQQISANHYSQKNLVFTISPQRNMVEIYRLRFGLSFEQNQCYVFETKDQTSIKPQNKNVKNLEISFKVYDEACFFESVLNASLIHPEPQALKHNELGIKSSNSKQISKDIDQERENKLNCFVDGLNNWILPVSSRNRVIFPYQEGKFQRTKIHLHKHLHLAFQGGGAKGLAYVGAYRSIQQQYLPGANKPSQKAIPIKSIIGSSAGGIIALAVSTGVPWYQLQRLCYKMNQIPQIDRFNEQVQEEYKPTDDYGNQISKEVVVTNILKILDQYGVIQQKNLKDILSSLSSIVDCSSIQEKVVQMISIISPEIGKILTGTKTEQCNSPPSGITNAIRSIFTSQKQKIVRKTLNWSGLLLHGALMKGESIHDIAQDCLMDFLLQKYYLDTSKFQQQLKECLEPQKTDHQPSLSQKIIKHLEQFIQVSNQLLQLDLKVIIHDLLEEEQIFLSKFVICLLNRFLITIDRYLRQAQKGNPEEQEPTNMKGLTLSDKHQNCLLSLHYIPLIKGSGNLVEYFISVYCEAQEKKLQERRRSKDIEKGSMEHEEMEAQMKVNVNKRISTIKHYISQGKLSYSALNSITNTLNLIKPQDCAVNMFIDRIKNPAVQRLTIRQLITDIFQSKDHQNQILKLLKLQDSQGLDIHLFFYFLEASQHIHQAYSLLASEDSIAKHCLVKAFNPFDEYTNIRQLLKAQVAKINMIQYYRLTGIELSFTSVDLDNKVLRFFNHKTTPNLPVCRAVQMTGSFPVGFKALKWRKEWGQYSVYLNKKRMDIQITGHEFTDGGMLANFPIRYLDNKVIRTRYFSHTAVKRFTILLGFGLDYLEPARYQKSQKQIEIDNQNKERIAIKWAELQKQLTLTVKLILLATVFVKTSGGSSILEKMQFWKPKTEDVENWSEIAHQLIYQIPLTKLLLKIVKAYPNADRNLNLEAFQNKVLEQKLDHRWLAPTQYAENYHIIEKVFFRRFFDQYTNHIHHPYHHKCAEVARNKRYLSGSLLTEISYRVNRQISSRIINKAKKIQIIRQEYLQSLKSEGTQIFKPTSQRVSQRELSLRLINIFLLHLKMPQNSAVFRQYGKLYVFMKFIAEDFEFQSNSVKDAVRQNLLNERQINSNMSKICFLNLYDAASLEEISNHLNLYNFHKDFFSNFVNQLRNKLQHQTSSQYEIYKKQQYEAYQLKVRKVTKDLLMKQYSQTQFISHNLLQEPKESLRRLTQLIYLMIKGRTKQSQGIPVRFKTIEEYRILTKKIIKRRHFQELLYDNEQPVSNNEFQSFIKSDKRASLRRGILNSTSQLLQSPEVLQQLGQLLTEKSQIVENKREQVQKVQETLDSQQRQLKLRDIFAFLRSQLAYLKKLPSFYISEWFAELVSQYNENSYQNVYSLYIHKFLNSQENKFTSYDSSQSQQNIIQSYNFLLNRTSKSNLISIMKNKILKDLKAGAKISREEYHKIKEKGVKKTSLKRRIVSKIFSGGRDGQEKGKAPITVHLVCQLFFSKKAAAQSLQGIEQFIMFILDDQTTLAQFFDGSSIYQGQRLVRMKERTLEVLFYELKAYFTKFELPPELQSVNFLKGIVSEQQFVDQVSTQIKKLSQANSLTRDIRNCLDSWLTANKFNHSAQATITKIEDNYIKIIEASTIKLYLESKLKALGQPGIHLCNLNSAYYKDMTTILNLIKQSIFLVKYIRRNRIIDSNTLAYSIKQSYSNHKIEDELLTVYKAIFQNFVARYSHLSELPLNSITQAELGNAFIIDFENIRVLAHKVYTLARKYYRKIKDKQRDNKERSQEEEMIEYASEQIYHIFDKGFSSKLSIPLLSSDWKMAVQSTNIQYRTKIIQLMEKPKEDNGFQHVLERNCRLASNSRKSPRQPPPLSPLNVRIKSMTVFQKAQPSFKDYILEDQNFYSPYRKDKQAQLQKICADGLHLIVEGVEHSNQYFGGLYLTIQQILTSLPTKINEDASVYSIPNLYNQPTNIEVIKMITCSNFHSVFGFLLSMGHSPEYIRRQMFKLQYKVNMIHNEAQIQKYFDSYTWINNTTYTYGCLLEYLEKQHQSLFNRIQRFKLLDPHHTSLTHEYKSLRMIFQSEKLELSNTYARILDEVASTVEFIDKKYQSSAKPFQFAKKFGLQYTDSLRKRYQYDLKAREAVETFREIVQKIFDSFEGLIYGTICNGLIESNNACINQSNAKSFAKGFIINRLLSTFQLKYYIFEQLESISQSPSITLFEYAAVAKRRIFLNFTVIDINRQRLTFLNKNSMPNMPLWAAILATSSLPFIHTFFEANKEWETTSPNHFHEFFIFEFFKPKSEDNRTIRYTSGNFLSSLPLQLLTNNRIKDKLFEHGIDNDLLNAKEFALCFNHTDNSSYRIVDIQVKKNYFNLRFPQVWKIIKSSIGRVLKWGCSSREGCRRSSSQDEYSSVNQLLKLLSSGSMLKILTTFANSNDNLILQWYYDKLIRLPIKIDTLQFNSILDLDTFREYKVNLLSQKAQQTIERSYQITRNFCTMTDRHEEHMSRNRFKLLLRVSLISRRLQGLGVKRQFFKVQLLNHSKWNQNNYSNFVVEYKIGSSSYNYSLVREFQRVEESEIIWLIEEGHTIVLKFNYPSGRKPGNSSSQERSQTIQGQHLIRRSYFQLSFKQILKEAHSADSYDYQFIYGCDKAEGDAIKTLKRLNSPSLTPVKHMALQYPRVGLKVIENCVNHSVYQKSFGSTVFFSS